MKKSLRRILNVLAENISSVVQILFVVMVAIFIFRISSQKLKDAKEIMIRDIKIINLSTELQIEQSKLKDTAKALDRAKDELARLQKANTVLDGEIALLKKTVEEKKKNLTIARKEKPKVEKLSTINYSQYNYAMKTSKLNRTHKLSRNDIDLILEYSKKYKIDPHLAIGIIWYESRFNTNAKSRSSSASGYGQFIKSTGAWVYKDLLKRKGKYDHTITPFQPSNSIPMVYAYLDYLIKRNKGDIRKVLVRYNGGELGDKYFNDIDKYFKTVTNGSVHLDKLEYKLKKNYGYIL